MDPKFTGAQVLLILIALPELKSASFELQFAFEDASVINTAIPTLSRSNRLKSNVKKLSLKIYAIYSTKKRHSFDYDSTFITFFSMFNGLQNLTIRFYESPVLAYSWYSEDYQRVQRDLHPTINVFRGLRSSHETLISLFMTGVKDLSNQRYLSDEMRARLQEHLEILRKFKKLKHLRGDSSLGSTI